MLEKQLLNCVCTDATDTTERMYISAKPGHVTNTISSDMYMPRNQM